MYILSVIACNVHIQCRTFDYDSSSYVCRLFEGAASTGNLIPSILSSRVGALQFSPDLYTTFDQSCSQCIQSRYLTC